MAMNIERALVLTFGLGLCLTACTPMDSGFGDSVRTNIAAQTIDPDPVYNEADISASGEKMAAGVERYRTDKVKSPKGIRTTSGVSGGAASGGGRN